MVISRGLKDATNKLWLKFEELKQEAEKCLLIDKSEVREEKSPIEVPISQVLQTVLLGPEKIQCPPSARSERIHPMLQF